MADEDWVELSAAEAPEGAEDVQVFIGGMSCDTCVRRVQEALAGVLGVERADVRVGAARIIYWPQAVTLDLLLDRIEHLGYTIPSRRYPGGNPVERFLNRMGDANDRALEGYELDCCKLQKK